MTSHALLTVSKVARLADCAEGTIRKEADAGHIPVAVRTADGERLFDPVDALVFGVNRRFKLELKAIDAGGASQLAEAITKSTNVVVAGAFPLIEAFAAGCDGPSQREISAALIRKMRIPINPFAQLA